MTTSTARLSVRRRMTRAVVALTIAAGTLAPVSASAYTSGLGPAFTSVTCVDNSGLRRISMSWDTNAGKPTRVSILGEASSLLLYRRLTRGELVTGTVVFESVVLQGGVEYRIEISNRRGFATEYRTCP